MYKLKFSKLQHEIFRLLCIRAGNALSQRDIARLIGVSPTAVGKAVKILEKERAVEVKSSTLKVRLVGLNRDNPKAMEMKRVENLSTIYSSGLIDTLEEKFPGTAIVLFGSYSRGDDTASSDIDIAIIGSKQKNIELSKFNKMLERLVVLQFYPSLREIGKELRENICNGIVLAGGLEL
ncbi:MAG: nucleotidyltransferase domain-containing protein [Candidatus Aenigmarchaeota archaeon]|nr:nucleotidyltransferase domain-containing protein [Candidatus Aenigmarchaeota archaeon]